MLDAANQRPGGRSFGLALTMATSTGLCHRGENGFEGGINGSSRGCRKAHALPYPSRASRGDVRSGCVWRLRRARGALLRNPAVPHQPDGDRGGVDRLQRVRAPCKLRPVPLYPPQPRIQPAGRVRRATHSAGADAPGRARQDLVRRGRKASRGFGAEHADPSPTEHGSHRAGCQALATGARPHRADPPPGGHGRLVTRPSADDRAPQLAAATKSATRSPIMMHVKFVLACVTVGMVEASATQRLSIPWTRSVWSTTASGSLAGPITQVPTPWW